MTMLERAGRGLAAILASCLGALLLGAPAHAQDCTGYGLPCVSSMDGTEYTQILQNGAKRYATIGSIQGLQSFPSGFLWDRVNHPVNVYRSPNGRAWTDLNPRTATPAIKAIFDGIAAGTTGVVYADASAANNSGAGTSNTTAKQGIRAAVGVCEGNSAYTTGCVVYVKAGDYDRSRSIMNAAGSQAGGLFALTKPTAIICYGGTCTNTESQLSLSWSANGTYPTVYQATRSAVGQVLDKITKDANGDPVAFTLQTSIANVSACTAQNCHYNDGTNEYVKRADGAVPSDTNTRVMLNSDVLKLPYTGANAFFLSGFTVYGGNFGTFQDTDTTLHTRDIVLVDSTFGFPSWSGTNGNSVSVDNLTGFIGLFRTVATYSGADDYNPHATNGGSQDWLFVDTIARNAGNGTNTQSNNCITGHDGAANNIAIRLIVLNGTCANAAGGAFRNVGYSQAWILNYAIDTDRGDLTFGGSVVSAGFDVEGGSTFWVQDSRCIRVLNCLVATSGAALNYRNVDDGGGQRTGGGTIQPF